MADRASFTNPGGLLWNDSLGSVGMNDHEFTADSAPAELLARLAELKIEHQDLDAVVGLLSEKSQPDQIQIARLKKKKLFLKDMISRLEDQLTPDIIA